ncbi:glycosyltransferase family 39 protein [Candidatus Gottesmanbacteria bacterium]|nr:glycosyltransferase family 39 protein [Candidatus Gottesmanbacteria bacterium]
MRRIIPIVILLFIGFVYTFPFFQAGFFETHDGEWAIIRLAEMQRELRDFQIPARWSDYLNHGYGYPLFQFTYPLPFYLGALISLSNIGLTTTIKILFVASVFLSGVGMYFLGRKISSSFGGLLGTLFYIASPFRLTDLYVRGSLGESLSFAIFPWLFYVSYRYIERPDRKTFILGALLLGSLILTHNVSALLVFPFWIGFLYVVTLSLRKNKMMYTLKYFLPLIFLGVSVSAFFILPVLFEKKFVLLSQIPIADTARHFVAFADFLNSARGYNGIPSFQLGLAHLVAVSLLFISLFFTSWTKVKKYRIFVLYGLFSIAVMIFFSNSFSYFLWKYPPLSWVDFPWRFLTPLTFMISFLTIFLPIRTFTKILGTFLIVLAIFMTLPYVSVQNRINREDSYYQTNDATTTSADELMPIWVRQKPEKRYDEKVEVETGFATLSNTFFNSKQISFLVESQEQSVIKVNIIYFPGWEFTLNGVPVLPTLGNGDGLMRLTIPAGITKVDGVLGNTFIRMVSNFISLVGLGVIFFMAVSIFFIKKNHEKH